MAAKHTLSPAPLPATKRQHISNDTGYQSRQPALSFGDSLYDELVLCIFSHLSWIDLCTAQSTSRTWYRLASDNELWRNLYLKVFGRTRLRGSKGFITRSDGREVKQLPGRVNTKQENLKDWKWMFRISSNWKNGRCKLEELHTSPVVPNLSTRLELASETHVLLAGALTITASSRHSDIGPIILSTSTSSYTLACGSRNSSTPCQITALAIDQSPPILGYLRLSAFLSTGEFSIFMIDPIHLSASVRKFTHLPNRDLHRESPTVQAVYNHPLLVTLTQSFSLSLYDLSDDTVMHTQTLTSFTSFPPTSLVLSTLSPTTYKLVLAYTIPVYPAHWSVGATELIISGAKCLYPKNLPSPSLSTFSDTPTMPPKPMCVLSTRSTRALDVPPGLFDEEKLHSMREQYSHKVSQVTDTQTDGKWVVLAPAEASPPSMTPTSFLSIPETISTQGTSFLNSSTTLQLYRLHFPLSSNSVSASLPKLIFIRNLHGQNGPIASLALADGRCVSLGLNGSLWVWDLEAGTGAEVCKSNTQRTTNHTSAARNVAFDERRIVTTDGSCVAVRRFDV